MLQVQRKLVDTHPIVIRGLLQDRIAKRHVDVIVARNICTDVFVAVRPLLWRFGAELLVRAVLRQNLVRHYLGVLKEYRQENGAMHRVRRKHGGDRVRVASVSVLWRGELQNHAVSRNVHTCVLRPHTQHHHVHPAEAIQKIP